MEKTDFEQIESLVKLMSNSSLTSLQLKTDGINLVLKKEKEMVTAMPSVVSVPVGKEPEKETTPSAEFNNPDEVVTAPLVGTFYAAPSEGADPFVSVGDTVKPDRGAPLHDPEPVAGLLDGGGDPAQPGGDHHLRLPEDHRESPVRGPGRHPHPEADPPASPAVLHHAHAGQGPDGQHGAAAPRPALLRPPRGGAAGHPPPLPHGAGGAPPGHPQGGPVLQPGGAQAALRAGGGPLAGADRQAGGQPGPAAGGDLRPAVEQRGSGAAQAPHLGGPHRRRGGDRPEGDQEPLLQPHPPSERRAVPPAPPGAGPAGRAQAGPGGRLAGHRHGGGGRQGLSLLPQCRLPGLHPVHPGQPPAQDHPPRPTAHLRHRGLRPGRAPVRHRQGPGPLHPRHHRQNLHPPAGSEPHRHLGSGGQRPEVAGSQKKDSCRSA